MLRYLTYLSVVDFNRVSGVYQLTYLRCILEVFREAFLFVTHDFMTMGYISPHLLSSMSNCVSADNLVSNPRSKFLLISRVLVPKAYMFII